MKTAIALAALAAGVLVPASTTAAQAADPPTCRGLAATIVAGPGPGSGVVRGTPGDDVVVVQDSGAVLAGAGNDVVCVVGSGGPVTVDGGAGDDVIDLSGWVGTPQDSTPYAAKVYAGDGRDELVGSAGADLVELQGTGPDQVEAGGGDDLVEIEQAAVDDGTVVSLGEGDDTLRTRDDVTTGGLDPVQPETPTAAPVSGGFLDLDAGPGDNTLELTGNTGSRVDAVRGRVRSPGGDLRFRGVDHYDLSGRSKQQSSFRGTSRAESVRANVRNVRLIDLAGGRDQVEVVGRVRAADEPSVVRGGAGRNSLTVQGTGEARVDLGRGRFTAQGALQARFSGFSTAEVYGVRELVGSRRADILRWSTCDRTTVVGGAGNDVVRPAEDFSNGACRKPAVLRGGAGNDRITGGPGNDRIDGGPGRDRADGAAGRNVCRSVERARRCRG